MIYPAKLASVIFCVWNLTYSTTDGMDVFPIKKLTSKHILPRMQLAQKSGKYVERKDLSCADVVAGNGIGERLSQLNKFRHLFEIH